MLSDYFDAWSSATPSILAAHQEINTTTTTTSKRSKSRSRSTHHNHTDDVDQRQRQQPPSSSSLRVEDRLQAAEKERAAKLEQRKKQLLMEERKVCTGRPKIDARSSALAEKRGNQQHYGYTDHDNNNEFEQDDHHNNNNNNHVFGRLTQRKPSNWRKIAELELQRKKEEQDEELQKNLLAKPTIDKKSEQMLHGQKRGVSTMLKWKEERDRKRRAAEDAKMAKEIGRGNNINNNNNNGTGEDGCTNNFGRPKLNPTSVAIATNRRILEGTLGCDPVEDLYRRHQEHEERMRQKYEEMYGRKKNPHDNRYFDPLSSMNDDTYDDSTATSSVTTSTSRRRTNNPNQVTDRLFQDAQLRKERREQQEQAAELMSYIDPVTGEVLFRPNINGDDNNENDHQADPGLWDRLHHNHTSSNNNDDEDHNHNENNRHHSNRHRRNKDDNDSQHEQGKPAISQYSRLLAEIHRGRHQQQQQQSNNNTNNNSYDENTTSSEPIYDRLSKEEIHHVKKRSKSKAASTKPNGGYRLHSAAATTGSNNQNVIDVNVDDDDDEYKPRVDARSRELDPRKNERGMSRIEALLQGEKERQRNIQYLQEQKKLEEERELARMRQQNHRHRDHNSRSLSSYNNNDHSSSSLSSWDIDQHQQEYQGMATSRPRSDNPTETFFERQAAWDAKRRQKVQAKRKQKSDEETKDCTFQPQTIGDAPVYLYYTHDDDQGATEVQQHQHRIASSSSTSTGTTRSYSQQHQTARMSMMHQHPNNNNHHQSDYYYSYRSNNSNSNNHHDEYYDDEDAYSPPIRVAQVQL